MAQETEIPIDRVVRKLKCKSYARLAAMLGVHRTCPSEWKRRLNGCVPPKHWLAIIDLGIERGIIIVPSDLTYIYANRTP